MPVGSPAFIQDSRTNVANVAPQHELFVNETYPQIIPSYWQSMSAESGGTQLESMECARLVIGSASGNHIMFIGGLDQNAPCSGRGTPLYPGQEGEREMFIENSNRIRVCATFSGELIYYQGYINGQPTQVNPSTQGTQPNNQPPQLIATQPLNGQHNIPFTTSGTNFISIFDENIASGTFDTDSYTVRLSGDFTTFLSGETSFHQVDDAEDRTQLQFIPYSGQLVGSSYYNVYIGTRISDDPGSTIPSTLTWSFVTAGVDPVPMVLKSHEPVSGAGSIALDSTITATFNKAVSGIVNQTGFGDCIYLWKDNDGPTTAVSGICLLDDDSSGKKLILTPDTQLTPLTVYRYSISGVTDSFNNLVNPKSGIAFSTATADTRGPVISGVFVTATSGGGVAYSTNLYNTALTTGVFNATDILIDFDEFLSGVPGAPVSGTVVSLVDSGDTGVELAGEITLDTNRKRLVFNVNNDLTAGNMYQLRISGVQDLNSNYITQTFPARSGIAFQAWNEPDITVPTINTITPASGSVGNAVNTNIVISFSEAISGTAGANPFTGVSGTILLELSGVGNIPGTLSLNAAANVITFNPNADLSGDRFYSLSVSGLVDLGTNFMTPFSGHVFRTIDNIAPVISGISPVSGFNDFDIRNNIVITFSEAISGTPNQGMPGFSGVIVYFSGTFGSKVAGACSLNTDRTQLTFNPTNDLAADDHFMVSVTGVRDVSGNVITHPGTGSIRTSGNSFKTASGPLITATSPTSGAINVTLGQNIIITFNKALSGVSNAFYSGSVVGLVLSGFSNHFSGTRQLNASKTTLTYNPIADLTSNKIYLLSVSGVRDEAGALISQIDPPRSGIVFTTQTIDTTAPTFTTTVPTSGVTGVAINTNFVVNFSEDISGTLSDVMPDTTVRVFVSHGTTPTYVPGTVTKTASNQLTFDPASDLSGDRWYRASVYNVYDTANNIIVNSAVRNSGIAFRTIDNLAPTLVSILPADTATNVNVGTTITATMNEVCSGNAGSIAASIFTLVKTAVPGTTLGGTTTLDATKKIFTFTPSASLSYSTPHTVTVANIRDLSNNIMTQSITTFTTASQPLNIFYENTGNTEAVWNSFSPDKSRMGIVRSNTPSSLNGKVIKRASWKMKRIGTSTSTVFCRIWKDTDDGGGDNGVGVTINSMPFNDIPTTATRVAFEKLDNTYAMTTDDCIGIEWGNSAGSPPGGPTLVMYRSGDLVDGDDTIRATFDGQWKWLTDEDADAKLEG